MRKRLASLTAATALVVSAAAVSAPSAQAGYWCWDSYWYEWVPCYLQTSLLSPVQSVAQGVGLPAKTVSITGLLAPPPATN